MKIYLETLIEQSIAQLKKNGILPSELDIKLPPIAPTKKSTHGDYASNVALILAKPAGISSRELAKKIVAELPPSLALKKVEIAGPGFINFFVSTEELQSVVPDILAAHHEYGRRQQGGGGKKLTSSLFQPIQRDLCM